MNDPKVGSVVPPPLGLIQLQQLLLMRYNDNTACVTTYYLMSILYIYYMYILHYIHIVYTLYYMYMLCIYNCDYAYFISLHQSCITSLNVYTTVLYIAVCFGTD